MGRDSVRKWEAIYNFFLIFDKDSDGYIDSEEFNRIIQKIEIIYEELKTLEGFKISKNSLYLWF